MHHEIADGPVGAEQSPERVDRFLVRRETEIVGGKNARVDTSASTSWRTQPAMPNTSSTASHDTPSPEPLTASETLFFDRRHQAIVVECCRRSIVAARMNCENAHDAVIPAWLVSPRSLQRHCLAYTSGDDVAIWLMNRTQVPSETDDLDNVPTSRTIPLGFQPFAPPIPIESNSDMSSYLIPAQLSSPALASALGMKHGQPGTATKTIFKIVVDMLAPGDDHHRR